MKVEFYKHTVQEQDIDNVVKTLRSLFLTTWGVVDEFEEKFARYLGCQHSVGLTSGTAALHLSLLAYGIGPGDEVITTPLTFVATANSILYTGATPVFVDVEKETGNMDASLIEGAITPRTKAILPVHLYGQMVDMKRIRQIADRHHLVVIEDAAHAIESQRDGVKPGQLGDTACFSFSGTKNITSGEGGAVSTNSEAMARNFKLLRLHGMDRSSAERYYGRYQHWDMELLGWKYNMYNIQAAMLLNQLENIEEHWQRREQICRMYEEAFSDTPELGYLKVLPGSKSGRHLFSILVSPQKRDRLLRQLQESGVGVVVNFRAIHLLKFYRETLGYKEGMFPIAEEIGHSTITLPLYPRLTDEEVIYVIRTVKASLDELV